MDCPKPDLVRNTNQKNVLRQDSGCSSLCPLLLHILEFEVTFPSGWPEDVWWMKVWRSEKEEASNICEAFCRNLLCCTLQARSSESTSAESRVSSGWWMARWSMDRVGADYVKEKQDANSQVFSHRGGICSVGYSPLISLCWLEQPSPGFHRTTHCWILTNERGRKGLRPVGGAVQQEWLREMAHCAKGCWNLGALLPVCFLKNHNWIYWMVGSLLMGWRQRSWEKSPQMNDDRLHPHYHLNTIRACEKHPI